MKIVHTADWHLGDRLGRIDRTGDLRRAVERVADICERQDADVLLVAGDIFSDLSRPDSLRGSIEHLQQTFQPFLLGGGTIVAITGNHDNETFCHTLQLVMTLAAPAFSKSGEVQPPGRLYLATEPGLMRLADADGAQVQFLLLPYPTANRYLRDEQTQKFGSLEEKNRRLHAACIETLHDLQNDGRYDSTLPTVLSAHIHVEGIRFPSLFRLTEQESIIFTKDDLPTDVTYIALGHIHQPQQVMGLSHVRYSSSIERLDLGERKDQKGVVVVDIGPAGLRGEPEFVPLPATKIYTVEFHDPSVDLPRLRDEFAEAQDDLVNLEFTYCAGKDSLEQILKELEEIFPRWYARDWKESTSLYGSLVAGEAAQKSFEQTVRDYLCQELTNHSDEDRQAILDMVDELMRSIQKE